MSNAAIYYVPEGFDTSQAKLMGRHAAGEGFLKAFVRHSAADAFHCFTRDEKTFRDFERRLTEYGAPKKPVHFLPFAQPERVRQAGAVFLPGPNIPDPAWIRRRADQRAYSLVGVTHTIASERVMDSLGGLLTAPVQPWDALICTSTCVRETVERVIGRYGEFLAQRLGASQREPLLKLPVISLGVDCDMFDVPNTSRLRSQWRKELGIDANDIAVLFMGRLSFHAKAHPISMYQALELAARKSGKKVHLIQAGWFANEHIEAAFKEGAREYCPSVNAIFLDGRKPNVRSQIWFAGDIFCSLSDNIQETFGLTPIEAMAAGLPLVVSDWDGYRDTVRDGVDGFRVATLAPAPGMGETLAFRYHNEIDNYDIYCANTCQTVAVDTEAAAGAFTRLIENPELRAVMGQAGARRARELYDWKVIVGQYEALWTELAALRVTAQENCPPREGEPAYPLRDDPFRVFANYPTGVLAETSVLHAAQPLTFDEFIRLKRLRMNNVGLLINEAHLRTLIDVVNTDAKLTFAQMRAAIPGAHPEVLTWTVLWMVKAGMLVWPDANA